MQTRRFLRSLALLVVSLVVATSVRGYILYTDQSGIYAIRWQTGPINLLIELSSIANLSDGNSLSSSVHAAMAPWNAQIGTMQLTGTETRPANYGLGNGVNEIVLDSTIAGESFGVGTLAVTVSYSSGNTSTEADIIFNTAYTWDSYRNNLRPGVMDIQRVALHELGHVLGLGHPDENGQYLAAIMNSRVSDIGFLLTDDIAGAQRLYGPPGFAPANDNFSKASVITLTDSAIQLTGSNLAATRESGEPNHNGVANGHSVWWQWTAPNSGTTAINTLGSDFDTVMSVYTGTALSALNLVAANDDAETVDQNPTASRQRTSKVSISATAGTIYYIAVDGWGDVSKGKIPSTGWITLNLLFGGGVLPVFTTQPKNQVTTALASVPFIAQASGIPTPTLQWQRLPAAGGDWVNLTEDSGHAGTTMEQLMVNSVTLAMNGDQFRCAAHNSAGTTYSTPATMTVNPVPVPTINGLSIQKYSTGATLYVNGSINANHWQWYHNGVPISGATYTYLDVSVTDPAGMGEYFVKVSNAGGDIYSKTVFVGLGYDANFSPTDYYWLKALEVDGVVYFLYKNPAQIARYDLASESWLTPWLLSQTPTDFAIAADAIYIASGATVTRTDRSFGAATTLLTADAALKSIQVADNTLVTIYIKLSLTKLSSYNRQTGQKIDSKDISYGFTIGHSYNPLTRRIYARTAANTGAFICSLLVQADGTFGDYLPSPNGDIFPVAASTFVLGTGDLVTDDSGVIYKASDLTYTGCVGDRFTDIAPTDTTGYYVLRGGRVSVTDGSGREIRAVNSHIVGARFSRKNGNLLLFAQPTAAGSSPTVEKVAVSSLLPSTLGPTANPLTTNLQAAQLLVDETGVVFIYSKLDQTIHRWSAATQGYLPSLSLPSYPNYLAYSTKTRSLYFDENAHQIRRIALDSGDLKPVPAYVMPGLEPGGFQMADDIFVAAEGSAGTGGRLHLSFAPAGTLVSILNNNYFSREYEWCPANRHLYYFTYESSGPNLVWEAVDGTGHLTTSNYSSSSFTDTQGMVTPIRASPDGSLVVLGSGYTFNGQQLNRVGVMANSFLDGVWMGGQFHTVRLSANNTAEVQTWSGDKLLLLRDRTFPGTALRLLPLPSSQLLLVTVAASGALVYQILDNTDLRTVYSATPPAKQAHTIIFDAIADCSFGAAPFKPLASASSGLPVSLKVVSGPATVSGNTVTITGAGTVTIRASQTGDTTYDAATSVAQSFVVNKAQLTATADNVSRTYGAANPSLTVSYSGFINSDGLASLTAVPSLVTTATATSTVGSYPITASGGVSNNYEISYVAGTLTVSKAPLKVTGGNLAKIQGAANPPLTLSYTGFVNDETSTVLNSLPVAATTATASSPIGVYPITVSGGSADNYTLTLVNGTLTVVPPSFAGIYFGTFASGARGALYVRRDSTATFIAYLPGRHSAIVVSLTVGTDGAFTVNGTEIIPLAGAAASGLALASPEAPVVKTSVAAASFTLTGQIAPNGALTGQLIGLGETFTGAADTGSSALAGLYTAAALNTAGGATYTVVGPSGQAVVVSTTPTAVDGATGTVNASGQLTATTSNNAALSLTINASTQIVSASLTPSGSSTPIFYYGLPDTITPNGYLANLSVRAAMAGGQTLIVGFVVNGGAKPMLVRAAGPVLGRYGLTGVVDPSLTLYTGAGAFVSQNDNWDASLASTFASLGAFAFDAASKDAALQQSINGPHTAQATATGPGAILVEAYDAGPNDGRKLVNLSARFQVGTGDNILIAGFVLSGTGTRQVLIRAVGPTLASYGVNGTLVDPQFSVFDAGGTVIASNDNWASSLTPTFDNVGAFHLLDASKDAAMVVTLQAGKSYTVQVSGVGGTTGEALIEIYLMP